MGYHTIDDGEQALIFNQQGHARLVVGPRRVYIFNQEIEYLQRRVASQSQYLVVKHKDGRTENVPGPCEMFMNRLEVDNIEVKNSIKLDANHLLVVYKQEGGHIERRIVRGPTIFVPNAHEWLHEFVWHGSDPSQPGRLLPKNLMFVKLCHIPHQFYYNVRDVRTNDDTLITVKLMLFYELTDIDTMLNFTHDPIADFINAVGSDVISFASQRNYEQFLQETNVLNTLESYPQLTSRAKRIGYNITKVVYRGYEAPRSLQDAHDDAIQTRTNLRLQTETEEQQQDVEEFKLKREKERSKLKQEMERRLQEHRQEMEQLDQTAQLEKEKLVHNAKLKKEAKEVETRVELERAEHHHKAEYLQKLKDMKVDMTRYLISQQPEFVPEKEVVVGPAVRTVARQQMTKI